MEAFPSFTSPMLTGNNIPLTERERSAFDSKQTVPRMQQPRAKDVIVARDFNRDYSTDRQKRQVMTRRKAS
jgi:hypothetical protein